MILENAVSLFMGQDQHWNSNYPFGKRLVLGGYFGMVDGLIGTMAVRFFLSVLSKPMGINYTPSGNTLNETDEKIGAIGIFSGFSYGVYRAGNYKKPGTVSKVVSAVMVAGAFGYIVSSVMRK